MTDDFERDLSEMLNERVAGMPDAYEAPPALLRRAHRRRTIKVSAIGVAVLLVAMGSVGAIAQPFGGEQNDSVSVATAKPRPAKSRVPARHGVATIRCPHDASGDGPEVPSAGRRVPAAGNAAVLDHLASFAASSDPRYVVLGPESWSCQLATFANNQPGMTLTDPNSPTSSTAEGQPISVINDSLGYATVGAMLACSVFDDPVVTELLPASTCPGTVAPPRTSTRVDANIATFVDTDGARGAGWIVLPTSAGADDGKISVLTCRPTTGLTAADCDTIIADWVARNDAASPPTTPATTTSTTSPPAGQVPSFACQGLGSQSIPSRTPEGGDPARFGGLASFLADIDGDPRFIVLGPRSWSCERTEYEDGSSGVIVFDETAELAPRQITPLDIRMDRVQHGPTGSPLACSVFDDPAVVQPLTSVDPGPLTCPTAGRTVTKVSARVATFIDRTGTRGAGWIRLPSAADDGFVSILTCSPTTGLTAADCDTIVADWAARADNPNNSAG